MINQQLINPSGIVIVGASNDIAKPGGKVLKNLLDHHFGGTLYAVNPKEDIIQGLKCHKTVDDLPDCDLAILAIAAKYCPETVEKLACDKNTRAFIILSAGFHEESPEGAMLEEKIVATVEHYGACLIGPNGIGMMNHHHTSVFTTPIPKLDPKGVDFISGSGATAVFIMEASIPKGLTFSSVYSVGNSAQIGVEDVLKYLDETFDPVNSSRVKMLYIESINKPEMLLKHASSLIRKGCKIAAIKSGSSEAGSRAAASHTGAMARPDDVVQSLFRKAGIVRCYSRDELATVACVFMHKPLKGKNMAIITHAGGPAVMLTDALSSGGLQIPKLKNDALFEKLFPGSSVANPIDFLATGTAEQLGYIIDACENDFENIDGMAVIFGSPGLFEVYDVYKLLDEKMRTCKKPIYPILPSVINVKNEIDYFIGLGRINFPEEVSFGNALCKVYNTKQLAPDELPLPEIDQIAIRKIIDEAPNGQLHPEKVQALFDAAGIPRASEYVVNSKEEAILAASKAGLPVVMKVVGPIHKSDVGGVVLDVKNFDQVAVEFDRMIKIQDTTAILIQPMLTGHSVMIGAKFQSNFGHMIYCGLGGIYVEVLEDTQSELAPVSFNQALAMIRRLKSYKIIEGFRGQEGLNEQMFADVIIRLSALCMIAPEISEMDINPLMGNMQMVKAVDARVTIEK